MSLIEFEVREHVAYIYLNRPQKLNAFTPEMIKEFLRACDQIKSDERVRAGIISGRGSSFCSGIDLEHISLHEATTIGEFYTSILEVYKPLIAAIHGFCLAQGMGIALCCDIRIASDDSKLGWPQVKRGISSVSGPSLGSLHLPAGFLLEHLFTGDFIEAVEAHRLGMINEVVPRDKLMNSAEELALKICENAPLAVRAMKEAALGGRFMSLNDKLRYSGLIMARSIQTDDAAEGLAAFKAKRKPVWKGR